jgi:hypothetical protein
LHLNFQRKRSIIKRIGRYRQQRTLALDLRLVMARQWFALIADVADYRAAFTAAYPIAKPDPTQSNNVDVCSHPEVFETFQALACRAMDGGALLEYLLADPSHHAYDGVAGIAAVDQAALDDRAQRFLAWAARFLTMPSSSSGQGKAGALPHRTSRKGGRGFLWRG